MQISLMIYHFNMNQESDFKNLCNLTTSVLGLRKGSLAFKSRKLDLQQARMIASIIARSEYDTNRSIIAKVLNRNRTFSEEKPTLKPILKPQNSKNKFIKEEMLLRKKSVENRAKAAKK